MLKFTEIGIDLGAYEIKIAKVVELTDEFNQPFNQLFDYEAYPVNSEMYSEEYFNTLKKAIKSFSKKIKKTQLSLNFVIPLNESGSVSILNVAAVSEKDLNEGIKFEAAQLNPEKNPSSYETTWKITNEYEELKEYELMLATLENKVIKEFSQFKTIKWRVNRIMLAPIILERFAKENEVIVDFGYNFTRLYMYKEGSLSKIETISTGWTDLENEVEKYIKKHDLDMDVEELASQIYIHNDLFEEEGLLTDVSKEVAPVIRELLETIKMNVRSFELQNGVNIDNVYYMGGLSNLKYLDTAIESELDMDVNPMSIVAKESEDVKYDLAGLVMISPDLKDKMDFSKFIKMNIDYKSILIASLTTSVSLAIAFGLINTKYDTMLEQQNASIAEQTTTISTVKKDIESLEFEISKNQRFLDKVNGVNTKKTWLSDALYLIPKSTPLTITVKNTKILNNSIELEGYSSDYSTIGFFAKELGKLGQASIVSIEDYKGKEKIYSVASESGISDEYLMTKKFKMTITYSGNLKTH